MIASNAGTVAGNRFAESGAYVSLGQPVHSSYRQLVCGRIFITAAIATQISACFGSTDLFFFCVVLSKSMPASTKTSRPSILRFHADKLDIFPDKEFYLNYTCANFNHKSSSAREYSRFPFYLFIQTRRRFTALLPHGLSPVEFFDGGTPLSRNRTCSNWTTYK